MKNIKSLKMHCEISERITWAKRTAKMIFVTVPYHSDRKYTRENPYVSYVRIDDGFCPAERGFKVSFSATACEYDNFKSIVLETKEKNFKIEFHEDGEIYFDGVSTAYCYDIDKWYDFELFFGKGMVLKINNRAVVKTEDCPDSIRQICLEIVGYPTYGPILQSSIGICGLEYSLDRVDFDSIDTSRPDYQLKAEKDDIESVAQALTYDVIAAMDQGKDKVRHSLNFTESGFPDIQICYRAEDEKYITKSGRVIRPKSWEGDKTVGVTAEISDGIHTIIKHFTFTIAKQEDFSDPQDMPDQEFFGIFSDGVWKREGKLDYTKLPEVLEAVKNGDYALAKTLLFTHFQNKHFPKEENLPFDQAEEKTAFDAGYAEMVLNNFHQLQQGYLLGVMDTTAQKAHMNTSLIKANSTMTFSIRAMHNESSAFLLLDTPVLTVRTNKRMLHYPAVETAMIRAGEYRHTALGADERKAEMYGEFLGNRTSYILVKFEIYGIGQREKILFAELGVQGKVVPETAGEKRLIVVKEFSNTWNSKSVKFCDLLYSVYSYEGLHDVNKWGKPPFADG